MYILLFINSICYQKYYSIQPSYFIALLNVLFIRLSLMRCVSCNFLSEVCVCTCSAGLIVIIIQDVSELKLTNNMLNITVLTLYFLFDSENVV